jgi:hypothetical protein
MKPLPFKKLTQQLKADLIGKDSYRGVTLTYAWLANQFGHFALGFIPAVFAYLLLKDNATLRNPAFWAAALVSACWLLFETFNLLLPVLESGRKHRRHGRKKKKTFTTPWRHLVFDTVTDLFFFWFGAFSMALVFEYSLLTLVVSCSLVLLLAYPFYYWYMCKLYLQGACYPFHMRLSQCSLPVSAQDQQTVKDFIHQKNSCRHLLVFGGGSSGKTSIGVGIAHEVSVKHQRCTYIPAMKLLSQFGMTDVEIVKTPGVMWSWRRASLLLIDDLHPGGDAPGDVMNIETFFRLLEHPVLAAKNRQALLNKKVIWVLGSEGPRQSVQLHWEYRLQQLGVPPADIYSIHLNEGGWHEKTVVHGKLAQRHAQGSI